MFANITCPICGHKHSIPETLVGRRVKCQSCESPFVAVAAGSANPTPESAQQAGAVQPTSVVPEVQITPPSRTLLAQPEDLIRYTCPRCRKSLQSPASMGGQKLSCPGCGQRLQIPSPPQPPMPRLDKTILAIDGNQRLMQSSQPPALPPLTGPKDEIVIGEPGSETAARREHCLECGRDVSGQMRLRTCPDCGCIVCSAACYRDHRDHAHGYGQATTGGVGMAVARMVLGIIGFVLSFLPCMGWLFGVLLGILGAIFSSIGIAQASKTGQGKGMAVTGLVLSILAIIWGPLFYFILFALVFVA